MLLLLLLLNLIGYLVVINDTPDIFVSVETINCLVDFVFYVYLNNKGHMETGLRFKSSFKRQVEPGVD